MLTNFAALVQDFACVYDLKRHTYLLPKLRSRGQLPAGSSPGSASLGGFAPTRGEIEHSNAAHRNRTRIRLSAVLVEAQPAMRGDHGDGDRKLDLDASAAS
jgi:hypothetical protein